MDDNLDRTSPDFDPELLASVDQMKRDFFPGPSYDIGSIVGHVDGRLVRIISGMYWDSDAPERRLSNHWTWHPIDKDGSRCGEDESGYGSVLIDPKPN